MKKFLTIFLICLLLDVPMFASFGAAQWDVKTTGAATNGGAFDPTVSLPGTDESQGSGTAITCTLTGSGTTATCIPAISSTTHGPGNFFKFASGTDCDTTDWFELNTQSAGTGTFNASIGTATAICVGIVGGSLDTPAHAITAMNAASNQTLWLQTGTYTQTATLSGAFSGSISGYSSSHGDQLDKSCASVSCPLITTATNSVDGLDIINNNVIQVNNVSFSSTAATRGKGIYCPNANAKMALNQVVLDGFSSAIATIGGGCARVTINGAEIKNSSSGTNNVIDVTGALLVMNGSYIHGNSSTSGNLIASSSTSGVFISNTIVSSNSNSTGGTDLIAVPNFIGAILNTDFVSNTTNSGNLINMSSGANFGQVGNSIFYNNTATAITFGGGDLLCFNDAAGSNTGNGTACGFDYTGISDPFVNKSTGNFALNTGAGAALKAAGFPGIFPGGTSTGYLDIGAVQSQASSGSSGPYGSQH